MGGRALGGQASGLLTFCAQLAVARGINETFLHGQSPGSESRGLGLITSPAHWGAHSGGGQIWGRGGSPDPTRGAHATCFVGLAIPPTLLDLVLSCSKLKTFPPNLKPGKSHLISFLLSFNKVRATGRSGAAVCSVLSRPAVEEKPTCETVLTGQSSCGPGRPVCADLPSASRRGHPHLGSWLPRAAARMLWKRPEVLRLVPCPSCSDEALL